MSDQKYIKWVLELANQEYKGDIATLRANIKHTPNIE